MTASSTPAPELNSRFSPAATRLQSFSNSPARNRSRSNYCPVNPDWRGCGWEVEARMDRFDAGRINDGGTGGSPVSPSGGPPLEWWHGRLARESQRRPAAGMVTAPAAPVTHWPAANATAAIPRRGPIILAPTATTTTGSRRRPCGRWQSSLNMPPRASRVFIDADDIALSSRHSRP